VAQGILQRPESLRRLPAEVPLPARRRAGRAPGAARLTPRPATAELALSLAFDRELGIAIHRALARWQRAVDGSAPTRAWSLLTSVADEAARQGLAHVDVERARSASVPRFTTTPRGRGRGATRCSWSNQCATFSRTALSVSSFRSGSTGSLDTGLALPSSTSKPCRHMHSRCARTPGSCERTRWRRQSCWASTQQGRALHPRPARWLRDARRKRPGAAGGGPR
jgi:hypothetical protein